MNTQLISPTGDIVAWRVACGLPIGPVVMTVDDLSLHLELIREEFHELRQALLALAAPGGHHVVSDQTEPLSIEMVAKEAVDLVYVTVGLLTHLGVSFDEAWTLVHRSNMTKVGQDGKVARRDDGKILKGPLYEPPVMSTVVPQNYPEPGKEPK